mgnify:CR=1 FL=1
MTDNNQILDKLDRLTDKLNDLVVAMAQKETNDQHIDNKLTKVESEHIDLEKIAAGDAARLEIQKWIWRAVITVTTTAVVGAIIWAVTQAKVVS